MYFLIHITIFVALNYNPVIPSGSFESIPQNRIAHGEPSEIGDQPYQVDLLIEGGDGNWFECSGAILEHFWILTSAHCLYRMNIPESVIYYHEVCRDSRKRKNYRRRLKEAFFHPGYFGGYVNDIALAKIHRQIPYGRNVKPVQLPEDYNPLIGQMGIVAGWGLRNKSDKSEPNQLQHTRMEIVNKSVCTQEYGQVVNSLSFVCALGPTKGSTCPGDSGAPLVLEGTRIVIGIQNLIIDNSCGDGKPTVFANVTNFLQWIKTTISNNT